MPLETLAGPWRLHVDRSTRISCWRSLPTSKSTGREMKLEHSGGVKAMTDEQIEQGIELIKEMLAEREAGANAKVIEGEAEVIPSLPTPASGGAKPPKS